MYRKENYHVKRVLISSVLCLFYPVYPEAITKTLTLEPAAHHYGLLVETITGNITLQCHEKSTIIVNATITGNPQDIQKLEFTSRRSSNMIGIFPMKHQTEDIKVDYTVFIPASITKGILSARKFGLIFIPVELNGRPLATNVFGFNRDPKPFTSEPYF